MPSPEATIKWSTERYTPGESAQRTWTVVNVPAGDSAGDVAAGTVGIQVGYTYPPDPLLAVPRGGLNIQCIAPNAWEVQASFARGTFDSSKDPTKDPPRVRWEFVNENEQTDTDGEGHALLNAAGTPFKGLSGTNIVVMLYVQRWEAKYNVPLAVSYANSVNTDAVNPYGLGALEPGQMCCRSFKPARDYTVRDIAIPINYVFELRGGFKRDDDGLWDGFKHRVLNAGFRAWYQDDSGALKQGEIVNANGKQPREPVLLDQGGAPLSSGYTVDGFKTIVSVPPPDGALFETSADGKAVWIKYPKHKKRAMSGLQLF
jgi:hypothetical protein